MSGAKSVRGASTVTGAATWSGGADRLRQALDGLLDHRRRTVLSLLGILVGIAAVMIVGTISRGGNRMVMQELETFGLNSIWIYRNRRDDDPGSAVRRGSGIDLDDVAAIQAQASELGVRRIAPMVYPRGNALRINNGNRYANAQFIGSGADFTTIANDHLLAGRPLMTHDIRDRNPVVLLAPTIVERLFDTAASEGSAAGAVATTGIGVGIDRVLGSSVRIAGRRFTVIGLLAPKSRDFLASIGSAGGQDANDRVVMPYTVMQDVREVDGIDNLQIEVIAFDEAGRVAERIKTLLQRRHLDLYRYASETMANYIQTSNRILGGVAIVGVVAASISLLVGGMGIMNMMGTAVLERTAEIGLLKAIGARDVDILIQFLLEAALISVAGGVLGVLVGGAGSVVAAWLTGFPLTPSANQVLLALGVSICVGMLAGLLPALRAARMAPVEALRAR